MNVLRTVGVIALVSVTATALRAATPSATERRRIIANVQALPASDLDASQPREPFARWLALALGPTAKIEWDISDCDLKPDFSKSPDTYPMCVVARGRSSPEIGYRLHIRVGTFGRGAYGKPLLEPQSIIGRGRTKEGCFFGVETLSALLDHVAETWLWRNQNG